MQDFILYTGIPVFFHEHWLAFDFACKTKKRKTTTIFNEFHATMDSCLVHTISKNAILGGTIIVYNNLQDSRPSWSAQLIM